MLKNSWKSSHFFQIFLINRKFKRTAFVWKIDIFFNIIKAFSVTFYLHFLHFHILNTFYILSSMILCWIKMQNAFKEKKKNTSYWPETFKQISNWKWWYFLNLKSESYWYQYKNMKAKHLTRTNTVQLNLCTYKYCIHCFLGR